MACPNLPPELWSHTFRFFSTADEVIDSSQDVWANIVSTNPKHKYITSPSVIECNEAKRALGLVSKSFYDMSRPVALESVALHSVGSLQYFAHQIAESPGFAYAVARYTKRIDLKSAAVNYTVTPERWIFKDLEFILDSSQNLTCLLLPPCTGTCADRFFSIVVRNKCSPLEVYRHPHTPLPPVLSSVRPLAALRVLHFQYNVMPRTADALIPRAYELPLLHTLIGPGDVVCSYFAEARFPSLRTLVLSQPRSLTRVHYIQFFRNHGGNIENLDIRDHRNAIGCETYELLVNIKGIVMDVSEVRIAVATWKRSVRRLGISARDGVHTSALHEVGVIAFEKAKGRYPNLTTIRIVNDDVARSFRNLMCNMPSSRARQLLECGLRLEDGHGDSLCPPSS